MKHYHNSLYIIKRLIKQHVRPYTRLMVMAIFFMVITAACTAIIVHLVKPTIDEIFLTHNQKMLFWLPILMLLVSVVKGCSEYGQGYLIKIIGQRILNDLQILLYKHLLFSDLELIQKESSGKLISRFTNDITIIRGAITNCLVSIAKHLLSVIFLIFLMFKLQPLLSLLTFVVFPLAAYPVQLISRNIRKTIYSVQNELANYTGNLDETFHSIKVVKSYLAELYEVNKAKEMINRVYLLYKKAIKLDSLTAPVMEILSGITIASIMWYGGGLVIAGKTTPGSLFAFITAFISAYRPFKSLLVLHVNFQEALSASRRFFEILDTKPKIINSPSAKDAKLKSGDISFKNVSLKIDNKTIFKDLSFNVKSGTLVAVVGHSGSGKTTIANLLMRLYEASSGQITVSGYNVRDILLDNLRNQISFVSQETRLFDTTVAKNISYSNVDATMDDIINAAKIASADTFINELSDKYDTKIGNQGFTLSGGQQQRLSIARAILKNSPILILDEATGNLDSRNEQIILSELKKMRGKRTIIIITHRITSITDADNIFVLKNGRIVEQGTHGELIANKSEYNNLYNKELVIQSENN